MSALALQAERLKLARLLNCDEQRLAGLAPLGAVGLRKLRAACTAALFDGDRLRFNKVVTAAKLLPATINALVAERAMGPLLVARVAGLLPPQMVVDMTAHMSMPFIVEVTCLLDPRSAAPMLRLLPVTLIAGAARGLEAKREYITTGRFVEALTDAQLRGAMAVLDDETLLRASFFVESPKRLEETIAMVSDERLVHIITLATTRELDLGGEVISLLENVTDSLRIKLVDAAMEHPDAAVGATLVEMARSHHEAPLFHSLVALLKPANGERLARLLA